jgi:hypothetical protein
MKFMNAPVVCQNFTSTLFKDLLLTFGHFAVDMHGEVQLLIS